MKKFILRLSILVLPLLIIELSITLLKDPGEILTRRYHDIKDVVMKGENAKLYTVTSQWGEFHEAYLQERVRRQLPPFCVVGWGSSRSSEMRAELFPGLRYYNCVAPETNILDYVAFYELFKENHYLPQTVVLNIDPWNFYNRTEVLSHGKVYSIHEKNTALEVKKSLSPYISKGMQHVTGKSFPAKEIKASLRENISDYVEFLSPSYFQSSLRFLTQKPVIATTEDYIQNAFVFRKDGSYTLYAPDKEEVAVINTRSISFSLLAKGDFFCDSCAAGQNMEILLSLLSTLKKENINVILFISPLHPELYDGIKRYEKNTLESRLREMARERKLLVIGSFNPHVYGLEAMASSPDFLDEYHISYKGMKRIFDVHRSEINSVLYKSTCTR